jgi:hypothetical protein
MKWGSGKMEKTRTKILGEISNHGVYSVHIISLAEIPHDTYGIVNKETGIIEHVEQNLHNAQSIAKQMGRWLSDSRNPDAQVDEGLRALDSPYN